jgi:hypothetical protein
MLSDLGSISRQSRSTGNLAALLPINGERRGCTGSNGHRSSAAKSSIALLAVLAVALLLVCSVTVVRCGAFFRTEPCGGMWRSGRVKLQLSRQLAAV